MSLERAVLMSWSRVTVRLIWYLHWWSFVRPQWWVYFTSGCPCWTLRSSILWSYWLHDRSKLTKKWWLRKDEWELREINPWLSWLQGHSWCPDSSSLSGTFARTIASVFKALTTLWCSLADTSNLHACQCFATGCQVEISQDAGANE